MRHSRVLLRSAGVNDLRQEEHGLGWRMPSGTYPGLHPLDGLLQQRRFIDLAQWLKAREQVVPKSAAKWVSDRVGS